MAKKILIVEDEFPVAENLKALLSVQGHKILEAGDGEAAVKIARKELPDLILLDILLPKMGGFDVCRILKSEAPTKHIKIIMITGLGKMGDVETAFQHGATDYLIKPVDPERLYKKIEKAFAPPA